MKRAKRLGWFIPRWLGALAWLLILSACTGGGIETPAPQLLPTLIPTPTPLVHDRPLRLVLVGSYGAEDPLSKDFRVGLLTALGKAQYNPGRTLELREIYLDSVRDPSGYVARVVEAQSTIAEFQPDVVIVCDDEAIKQLLSSYPDPQQTIIYCGLDGEPSEAVRALPNAVGILEWPYPVQTVRLAQAMMPEARSFVFLTDDSTETRASVQRIYQELTEAQIEGIYMPPLRQVEKWEYWQRVVLTETVNSGYNFILLGNYHALRDEAGKLIPEDDVLQWTLTHTSVPVYALRERAVEFGAIGGLVNSRRALGEQVGGLLIQLQQGVSPSSLGVIRSSPNPLLLNLAATDYWNLGIPLKVPVTGKLYRTLLASPGGTR